jgi:tripartite-type tricarboxylate transporter receptor subunit TctC
LERYAPADIVSKLNYAAVQALKTPAVQKKFEEAGAEIVSENRSTPDYLRQFVKGEIGKWTPTIKASGVIME